MGDPGSGHRASRDGASAGALAEAKLLGTPMRSHCCESDLRKCLQLCDALARYREHLVEKTAMTLPKIDAADMADRLRRRVQRILARPDTGLQHVGAQPHRLNWNMRAAPECILQLSALSSRLERYEMTIDVTLAIYRAKLPAGQTTLAAVKGLAGLGGRLVSWTPDLNGAPARAKFVFATEAARDEFLAAATCIAGISLAVPEVPVTA